jgi:hypothetical protein
MAVVTPRVTQAMNAGFTRTFTAEEVDNVVAQMQALKAPNPYGFGVCFFQHHWETVGEGVRNVALEFLNYGWFDPSINATHVVLILMSAKYCIFGSFDLHKLGL